MNKSGPSPKKPGTAEKALEINLDSRRYGTFAEIGAGQEVVRWFFQVGGAAGTVAKSISAYDMKVSDSIYGPSQRYVSRQRLEAMLDYEQSLTRARLDSDRGSSTGFFSFADTVSARNFHGTNDCHAWMGIQFQTEPGADDSRIVIHVRMLDQTNPEQQEALGIVGVNLIHAALMQHQDANGIVAALLDNLSADRVEIDMIDFGGAAFADIDNRVMTLRLVELGLSQAAMFDADGNVLQPSEALRKRPLLVQRGRFRPVTHVNIDLLDAAQRKFAALHDVTPTELLPIMEISMHNLIEDSSVCLEDFVSRAEAACATGCPVMVSDFREYHRLTAYLARSTNRPIGLAMGLGNLQRLFDEQFYADLDGGILESFGRLFKEQVRIFVYPQKDERTGAISRLRDLQLDSGLRHLFDYLCDRGHLIEFDETCSENLDIRSPDVLRLIGEGNPAWMDLVPQQVAERIKALGLFGLQADAIARPRTYRTTTRQTRDDRPPV